MKVKGYREGRQVQKRSFATTGGVGRHRGETKKVHRCNFSGPIAESRPSKVIKKKGGRKAKGLSCNQEKLQQSGKRYTQQKAKPMIKDARPR
jgi:hypothetical protein